MTAGSDAGAIRRRRLRRLLFGLIGVLYAVSIPWYRTGGAESGVVLGLPSWVALAILCYVAAAIANSAAWLLTDVPDAPEDEEAP